MENEKFKELYLRLCKGLTPIDEEPKSEYDLGIDFEPEDELNFEEEQELDKWWNESVDEIASLLIPLDDCEEDDE